MPLPPVSQGISLRCKESAGKFEVFAGSIRSYETSSRRDPSAAASISLSCHAEKNMARSRSKLPKPAKVSFTPPVIERDRLDQILADLGLPETADGGRIRHMLTAHVNAFALSRYVETNTPTIHQDVHLAHELVILIDRLKDGASRFSPMTSLLLDVGLSDLVGGEKPRQKLFADLETYHGMLTKLGEASFSKNRRDDILRNAIGGLMLYLEILTGKRATVQRARSDFGRPPRLGSPEARAIGALLRFAEPNLADTTLVNTIEGIRRAHRGMPLTTYEHQLLLGGAVTPF